MYTSFSLMIATCLFANTENKNANAQDAARMEGVYRFDSIEVDGTARPAPPFETNKVIVMKDGRFVIVQGPVITHGELKVDATKTPKQYDSTLTSGVAKGAKFPCIYELTDDTFKLCGPYAGGNRPTEFGTKPNSGLIMQVLKREKQTVPDALNEVARKELAGNWVATSCVHDGKAESEETTKKLAFTWKLDGKITGQGDDGVKMAGETKIDATANPMTIDVTYTDGNLKGQTVLGFAAVDGDTLTICYAPPGKPRPTELKSDPGSGISLLTYHRETAEKK